MLTDVQREYALADCLRRFVQSVDAERTSGNAESAGLAVGYLLTPKQCDEIDRICDGNGWERLSCYAVMINPGDIRHILHARKGKDGLDGAQIADIVAKAYSARSLLKHNPPSRDGSIDRKSDQQSIMLNTHQKIQLGGAAYYAVAILEIRIEGSRRYLAPVTCYHATEAKKRRLLKPK